MIYGFMRTSAVLILSFAPLAKAQTPSLDRVVRFVPKASNQSCADQALALGQVLASKSGLPLVGATCATDRGDSYDLRVTLEARDGVEWLTTTPPDLGAPLFARYKTESACIGGLESDSQDFTAQTGAPVAFSYCHPAYGMKQWSTVIHGFTNAQTPAKKRPFFAVAQLLGQLTPERRQSLEVEIPTKLAARGVATQMFRIVPDELKYDRIGIFYYAPSAITFTATSIAFAASSTECLRQAKSLGRLSARYPVSLLSSACIEGVMNTREELVVFTYDGWRFDAVDSVETFINHNDCEAKKDGLEDYYKRVLGRLIDLSVCSHSPFDKTYRVKMYAKKLPNP